MKTRGIISVVAGIFLIVVMSAVWYFIWHVTTTHASSAKPEELAVFGKFYVAFAMIVFCGFAAIANGFLMIRRGRPHIILVVLIFGVFFAAIFVILNATGPLPKA